jgi:HlyD family secretion protein
MKIKKQYLILATPVIIVLLGILFISFFKQDTDNQRVFVGLFESTEIKVASEIPGRIETIYVDLGDEVKKGQLLASIESDILDAKVQQAEGAYEATKSQNDKAKKGARQQEISAAKNKFEMAKSQFEFADKSYNRLYNMSKDSLISAQNLDEVIFKRKAAEEQMLAAKSIYDMAVEGARNEDKKAAQGQLDAYEGKVNEAKAYYKELKIYAPIDGEVASKLAQESEVMPAGYPIFTIQNNDDIHAIIHVREDFLNLFPKGIEIEGTLPAFDNKKETFVVSYISPLADFADWIPTADKGRLDMKTFEIHLKPKQKLNDLRPGMSINIKL